jgi:hypothetical protein
MYEFDVINYWTTGILVFFFVATGTACARRCWQWMWLLPGTKTELWELYGTFSLMGTMGCAAGVAAFMCLMLGNMYAPSSLPISALSRLLSSIFLQSRGCVIMVTKLRQVRVPYRPRAGADVEVLPQSLSFRDTVRWSSEWLKTETEYPMCDS